ncbi:MULTISPECIES: hypothetical protein [Saccharibacillus]|uniref:Uncharacterized protein n=1 Tax=Saccharibacillus brassicae TaxID=2583377 RepID=A0A4Y6UVS2_SACBS|nr:MULTISPECIES: hypothetical protein [Saccharibacillus]MWJ29570.1 hypothetical protein [Saccharibacillus sp. WB 17]QDH21842.1 hypothetical protein FFV09_13910 [Saccharibacillus brassicae]
MQAATQNLFVRIHLLHYAEEQDISIREALPKLERAGYRVADREVKQELENLAAENLLTAHGEEYTLTGAGITELRKIRGSLGSLCSEVLTAEPAGKAVRA